MSEYLKAENAGVIGKSEKEIINELFDELRAWQAVAKSLNNSLCCYLDYCVCGVEYKSLAPKEAIMEYNKLRCGVGKPMKGKPRDV